METQQRPRNGAQCIGESACPRVKEDKAVYGRGSSIHGASCRDCARRGRTLLHDGKLREGDGRTRRRDSRTAATIPAYIASTTITTPRDATTDRDGPTATGTTPTKGYGVWMQARERGSTTLMSRCDTIDDADGLTTVETSWPRGVDKKGRERRGRRSARG